MSEGRRLYSHRYDDAVPSFDDTGPRTVMDANCALCAKGARWIARSDTRREFKIIPLESELGAALMTHYGMDPHDPTSWLYLEDGRAYNSLDAFMRVGRRLGGVWHVLSVGRILPKFLADSLYRLVARNRYRFFGRADMCAMPDPDVRERLLT